MTTTMPLNLTCPCCGTEFESMTCRSTNTAGPLTTDLYQHAGGLPSLPLEVHGCAKCGFCGYAADFDPGKVDAELKKWVYANLTPHVTGDRIPASQCFEHTALLAERRRVPPNKVGLLWLKAGWCEAEHSESGVRCRREAVVRFEAAMERNEVAADSRAVITYLIGELYRRVGDPDKAKAWFARVPDAVGGNAEQKWLIDLAIQQSTNPTEMVDEGRGT